jgi:hypothetical protein
MFSREIGRDVLEEGDELVADALASGEDAGDIGQRRKGVNHAISAFDRYSIDNNSGGWNKSFHVDRDENVVVGAPRMEGAEDVYSSVQSESGWPARNR